MKTVECKVDLHNHLAEIARFMPKNFNKVIDYAHKRLGDYGILGITSSKSDGRYKAFAHLDGYDRKDFGNAFYVPEKKLWVVNTDEIYTGDGHLLTVGSHEDEVFEQGKELYHTLEEVKKRGAINILAHPEAVLGVGDAIRKRANMDSVYFCFPRDLSQTVSAVEWNAQLIWLPFLIPYGANDKFLEFYKDNIARYTYDALDKPMTEVILEKRPCAKVGIFASSDGHTKREIVTSYTNLTMPHPDDVKDGNHFVEEFDRAARNSQLTDIIDDETGDVVERFAIFNGKMKYARWGAFKHGVKSAGLALIGMK